MKQCQALYLSHNEIDDDGMTAFIDAIKPDGENEAIKRFRNSTF